MIVLFRFVIIYLFIYYYYDSYDYYYYYYFPFFLFLQEPWFLLWHYIMHLVRGSNLTVVVNFVVGEIKMAGAVPKTLTEGGG